MPNKMTIKVDDQEIEIEVREVGPAEARKLLASNDRNRKQRIRNTNKIARAMEIQEFRFAGDPIRLTKERRLIDGQHRLEAIIASGTTQTLLVMTGFDDDVQLYIDSGSGRRAGDQISMFMNVPNANTWSSIASLAIRWDAGDLISNILSPSIPEIMAFCEDHADEVDRAVKATNAQYPKTKARRPVAGALYFYAHRQASQDCETFFRKLADGSGRPGEAVFVLRETFIARKDRSRLTALEELALFTSAWNLTRQGRVVQRLQLPRHGIVEETFTLL